MIGVVEELMRSSLWKECSQEISTTKEVTLWYSALVDGLDMVYDVYENAKNQVEAKKEAIPWCVVIINIWSLINITEVG